MKPLKIIFPLLIIILLTSCVGQKQLNIDELLKKYNSITESELESSMFTVYKSGKNRRQCIALPLCRQRR